jgi:acyl carrier protein
MSELESRLRSCFAAVFPALPEDRIPAASVETVPQWDSVAHITLVDMIQQEFQVRVDDSETETLTSYRAWIDRLQ